MSTKDKKAEKHIHELEEQLNKLTAENQDLLDKLQRLGADYANYQKRVPRQVAESVAYEKKNIVRSLLPSLDNFEHALSGFKAAPQDETSQNIIKGVQLIFDHILDALKAVGVEKAVSVGQPFDPSRHEAMLQRTEPDQENGVVLEEFQPCYLLGGEVVRPARVIVNKLPDAAAAEEPQTPDADASEDIDETTDIEPEVQ
ncbi:MAG: nucleotide exchange factor GrpE [Phycisphaerae bacterium]|nr:nucleotide exchange factor GrpE [Phycisphaerae bacterium]